VAIAAARGNRVVAIEGDRSSADDLKANVARAGLSIEARHQSVETFLAVERSVRASALIVDPPRTGVSRQAMTSIIALNAPRIVYVSCDVATLARDARLLADSGYALQSIRLFDLFPNTAHVESLAVFER
jgi:tRNA/tmRNA/rRNA uracil-C5-methylase (TrmA/RlmC/RlmD family)